MLDPKTILKLAKYDGESKTEEEEDKILLANNARRLTPDEWMDLPESMVQKGGELYPYWPCRLKTPGGLLARGGYYGDWRGVDAGQYPYSRLGVLGVPLDNKPHKHQFVRPPAKCACGAEKR